MFAVIRIVLRVVVFLGSAALGLLAAALLVDGVEAQVDGFIITAVVYAVVQSIISPFLAKFAAANARALLGGIGIVAAFVALVAASLIGDALTISGGLGTWIIASLTVWLCTALATLLLPVALLKAGTQYSGWREGRRRAGDGEGPRKDGEAGPRDEPDPPRNPGSP